MAIVNRGDAGFGMAENLTDGEPRDADRGHAGSHGPAEIVETPGFDEAVALANAVDPVLTRGLRPGKTKSPELPARTSLSNEIADALRGMRCSRLPFERVAGSVHQPRSISAHAICSNSDRRAAVSKANLKSAAMPSGSNSRAVQRACSSVSFRRRSRERSGERGVLCAGLNSSAPR